MRRSFTGSVFQQFGCDGWESVFEEVDILSQQILPEVTKLPFLAPFPRVPPCP
jgi:hypothetical protein